MPPSLCHRRLKKDVCSGEGEQQQSGLETQRVKGMRRVYPVSFNTRWSQISGEDAGPRVESEGRARTQREAVAEGSVGLLTGHEEFSRSQHF